MHGCMHAWMDVTSVEHYSNLVMLMLMLALSRHADARALTNQRVNHGICESIIESASQQ